MTTGGGVATYPAGVQLILSLAVTASGSGIFIMCVRFATLTQVATALIHM